MVKAGLPESRRSRVYLRISVNVALCAAVAFASLRWLHWLDRVVDADGQEATLLGEGTEGLWVRYIDLSGPDSKAARWLPDEQVAKRIPGVRSMWRRLDAGPIVAALLIQVLIVVVVGYRWGVLLRGVGAPIRPYDAIVWHLRATAADVLGIGQIGMEACRVALARKHVGGAANAVTIQVVERFLGLTALAVLALVGLHLAPPNVAAQVGSARRLFSYALAGLLLAGCAAAIVARRLPLDHGHDAPGSLPARWLHAALSTTKILLERPALTLKGAALSFSIHILMVVYYALLARSLAMDLSFTLFLIVVPVVSFALALPISIAGLGVFEGSMVLLLTSLSKASAGEVLVLCALYRVMSIPQRLLVMLAFWLPTSKTTSFDRSLGPQ